MGREIQVTFDCAVPARLAEFWAHALGGAVPNPPDGSDSWDAFLEARGVPPERRNDASAVEDPDGVTPRIFFQRVPEGSARPLGYSARVQRHHPLTDASDAVPCPPNVLTRTLEPASSARRSVEYQFSGKAGSVARQVQWPGSRLIWRAGRPCTSPWG